MRFFEDTDVRTMESIGITNLLSNITTREGSHKGGWARLLKCQLEVIGYQNVKILDNKDSLSDFDNIIFDLGAEFSGALNMFGGLDEKVFKRLQEIRGFGGKLFSWRNELPDISSLESRRNNQSTVESFKSSPIEFIGDVSRALEGTRVFDHVYRTSGLLIGDSHTPSVWTPDFMIERRDGRTLKGMVEKQTIKKYVELFKFAGVPIEHLHVHCGAIDIRHHAGRELDPEQHMASLVMGLVNDIHEHDFVTVTLTHTMGIEDESRELPKTGYFKGAPFSGDWNLRNRCRLQFNEVVDDYTRDCPGWKKLEMPGYFFDESNKLRFEVMERPQSVHLSPEHYRWDLDKNVNRW